MNNQVAERFSEYYEKWASQQDEYFEQLLGVSREGTLREQEQQAALVSKLTAHFKEYYTVKWAAAHEDVLAFFAPVWLTSVEIAYSWLTGWKPSTIFRLMDTMRKSRSLGESLVEFTEEQLKKMEELRMRIRLEEEKVEREMERQQMAIADRKMVELARLQSRVRNGDPVSQQMEGLVEVALKEMMTGLERVVKAADCVRLKTLKGMLEMLNPLQCVDFFTAICMLRIHLRQWGKRKGQPIP